jgi:rod shape-determining protein MreC
MNSKNNRLILILLTILCVVMIAVTTFKDAWLMPLRTAVGYVLMPVQSGVNRVGKALYNSVEDSRKMKTALEENKKLSEQVDQLIAENTRLREDQFELDRLRKLYKLSEKYGDYHMIGARIIAKDSSGWFKVFRIDKGSSDGVQVDMNIIAGGGLVGIVTDVGANYATVRSIIDDVSRVSAMAMQSGDTCIVSGDLQLYKEGKLKLGSINADADVKDGDKIITSSISTKYLPGLLIGYAKGIKTDSSTLTKSGYLVPAADFGTLQEVLVITDLKSSVNEGKPAETKSQESSAPAAAETQAPK